MELPTHYEKSAYLLPSGNIRGYDCAIYSEETQWSGQRFFDTLIANPTFCLWIGQRILECEFDGLFWEARPFTAETLSEPFHFKCVVGNMLAQVLPNPRPFARHLESDQAVVNFPNLGRNAELIVPTACGPEEHYGHLAAFLRGASESQQVDFWQTAARCYLALLTETNQPLWISTAGLGVSWLHLRIDRRPKYYRSRAYREFYQ